jgi:hypothetical protein
MDYPSYYQRYLDRCEILEADDVLCNEEDEADIATIPTDVIVSNILSGLASVGDDDGGEELARRGELASVPGDDWGEPGGRW